MNLRQALLAIGAATVATTAVADDGEPWQIPVDKPSYYLNVFGGQSMTILGSEDRRTGFGIGFGYGRPEPRFNVSGVRSQLVFEAYYDHTGSRGASGQGPNEAESFGILAYGHWRWPKKRGGGLYATLGWGLQYTNRTSVDLDSQINSTPMVGFGVAWDTGQGEASIGLRLLHISNAGLVGRNQGQNQLFLVYTLRF